MSVEGHSVNVENKKHVIREDKNYLENKYESLRKNWAELIVRKRIISKFGRIFATENLSSIFPKWQNRFQLKEQQIREEEIKLLNAFKRTIE